MKPFRAATPDNGNGPVKVISAGRLVPDKNFATLIEAVARSASAAELEIAGTGFLEDELKQLAARRGVPVRFRGHVSPAEMPGLYASADVYALISTYEPFGVTVREAAAAGLPSCAAGPRGRRETWPSTAATQSSWTRATWTRSRARSAGSYPTGAAAADGGREPRIDRETDGVEVDAFVAAVAGAAATRYSPSSAGSTSAAIRATDASGR